jgi:hypothetical protein
MCPFSGYRGTCHFIREYVDCWWASPPSPLPYLHHLHNCHDGRLVTHCRLSTTCTKGDYFQSSTPPDIVPSSMTTNNIEQRPCARQRSAEGSIQTNMSLIHFWFIAHALVHAFEWFHDSSFIVAACPCFNVSTNSVSTDQGRCPVFWCPAHITSKGRGTRPTNKCHTK